MTRLMIQTPTGFVTEDELRSLDFQASMASLAFCDLAALDLTRLDLRAVDFTGADLRDADLRDADLRGACFLKATLVRTRFSGALVTDVLWPAGHPEPLVRRIPGYHTVDRQVV